MDYDQPRGAEVQIAVARVPATDQAHRIGSLFFNFGGPGGTAVDYLQGNGAGLFADLNKRFDIVAFDPRGVGQSTPSIDCRVNQEQLGIYSQPVPTPQTLDRSAYIAKVKAYVNACVQRNGEILRHVSTANVARDMDALRAAVGDRKLTYLGFSYGTFLGATYAALFPRNYRALVLDGPVDAEQYINDPIADIAEQTAAFEDALDRFLAACKADQTACQHFGGNDPSTAFDALIAQAEQHPIDASGYTPDPRPVDGDDIRMATASLLYAKQAWGLWHRRWPRPREATRRSCGPWSTSSSTSATRTPGRSTRAPTATSRSGQQSSATPAIRRSSSTGAPARSTTTRTSGGTVAMPSSATRSGRPATRTPTPAPSPSRPHP